MHDDKELLAVLLLRWEEAWDLGEEIPAADLCVDCPEIQKELEQKIRVLKRMAWMKKDAGGESE